MEWLRAHPYIASLVGALVLIGAGGFIVGKRSAVDSGVSSLRAWGGVGANLSNPSSDTPYQTLPTQENLYTAVKSGAPFNYIPTNVQIPQTQAGAGDFDNLDLEELLGMLSRPQKSASESAVESSLDIYSFIPSGLLSTTTTELIERTPIEQDLYNYANEAASYIQSYEDIYRSAPQILRDQFEDRQNPAKNASLIGLADRLVIVGDSLLALEELPPQVETAHANLGESYRSMGNALRRIPTAVGEEQLIDAMLAYNATAEDYTKNYIALATIFTVHGVVFKPDDPGSIFTFTQSSPF